MKKITQEELDEKIKAHKRWLDGLPDGEHLVLIGYDLSHRNLSHSDLSYSALSWNNLSDSALSYSSLRRSDLRGSDLRDCTFDYSSFPLWCGGSRFKCSEKLVRQLFAHICTLEIVDASDEMKEAIKAIRGEALKSHRAGDLGLL